jgi:hypothetical protein
MAVAVFDTDVANEPIAVEALLADVAIPLIAVADVLFIDAKSALSVLIFADKLARPLTI